MARPRKRNRAIALGLGLVVAGMVGLSFAAVPLYRLFCQVTGFGGTTQVAASAPETVGTRTMTVRFNTDVSPELGWRFAPEVPEMQARVGERKEIRFRAENLSDETLVSTATFNVTPNKAGQYFTKVQCFCFEEQTLEPGAQADMVVSFFVDPAIEQDPNLEGVSTITLSYTLFRHPEHPASAEQAQVCAGARPTTLAAAGSSAPPL